MTKCASGDKIPLVACGSRHPNEPCRGVAQSGSARALGAWGRRFKSCHPDQNIVAPWSSGLRHRPFTAVTRVRVPMGSPFFQAFRRTWAFSSVGQSSRLITDRSGVQVPEGPPRGPVVQLVSTPACHAGGRGFEPLPGRHFSFRGRRMRTHAGVAQLAEQLICNQQVAGSSPIASSIDNLINVGRFPSGQREQTVNLPQIASVVRIHPCPPDSREWRNWQTR